MSIMTTIIDKTFYKLLGFLTLLIVGVFLPILILFVSHSPQPTAEEITECEESCSGTDGYSYDPYDGRHCHCIVSFIEERD